MLSECSQSGVSLYQVSFCLFDVLSYFCLGTFLIAYRLLKLESFRFQDLDDLPGC